MCTRTGFFRGKKPLKRTGTNHLKAAYYNRSSRHWAVCVFCTYQSGPTLAFLRLYRKGRNMNLYQNKWKEMLLLSIGKKNKNKNKNKNHTLELLGAKKSSSAAARFNILRSHRLPQGMSNYTRKQKACVYIFIYKMWKKKGIRIRLA